MGKGSLPAEFAFSSAFRISACSFFLSGGLIYKEELIFNLTDMNRKGKEDIYEVTFSEK